MCFFYVMKSLQVKCASVSQRCQLILLVWRPTVAHIYQLCSFFQSSWVVVVVLQLIQLRFTLSADIDMKKDIETLIAEERADIILKYATVSSNTQNSLSVFYLVQMDHVVFYGIFLDSYQNTDVFESVEYMDYIEWK